MSFDKYRYYLDAVQAPEVDMRFLRNLYRRVRGRDPQVLREDFCGTFANLVEWVRLSPRHRGLGIDLDAEPLDYGRRHHLSLLKPGERDRLKIVQGNVLTVRPEPADIIAAMNFSFFTFHSRAMLTSYLRGVYRGLARGGLAVLDCFGGSDCLAPITDRTRKRGYWYIWEQASYEPITHRAKFYIHFKRDGERIRKRVFRYDWRLWSIPEIREIMAEVGFRKSLVYWQDDRGHFRPARIGEPCAAWLAYIIGLK